MGIFDNLVHPQSEAHMELLQNILVMTYIILIPYFCVLIGSALLSVFFNKKGLKDNNPGYIKFAKRLIDLVTFNKSIVFALGLVPMLSIVIVYAQLLKNVQTNITGYLLFSAILFICGVIFIYIYKYSFHLKDILKYTKDNEIDDASTLSELNKFRHSSEKLYSEAGSAGLIILLLSSFLFVGSIQLASDSLRWENSGIIDIIFSLSSIINYCLFLVLSITIAAASFLFVNFKKDAPDSTDENWKELALKSGAVAIAILPLFIVLSAFITSPASLSGEYFIYTVITLVIVLLIAYKFYAALKTKENNYTSMIFLFVLFVCLNIYKDYTAFATTVKYQTAVIADEHAKFVKEYKEGVGLFKETVVNGEDIFKGRCLACHKFDVVVVGPPYNKTLPKYEEKFDDLVEYILNPYKIDPKYPAMPNQGLKPNEAKAVAEYIVNTYKKGD